MALIYDEPFDHDLFKQRWECADRTCQAKICGFRKCPYKKNDKFSCSYVKDAIKAAGL